MPLYIELVTMEYLLIFLIVDADPRLIGYSSYIPRCNYL